MFSFPFSHSMERFKGYNFVKPYPSKHLLVQNSNSSTRKKCEMYSKLTMREPERGKCRRSGVFIVNFEHISLLFPVFFCWLWTGKCFLGSRVVRLEICAFKPPFSIRIRETMKQKKIDIFMVLHCERKFTSLSIFYVILCTFYLHYVRKSLSLISKFNSGKTFSLKL